MNSLFIALYSTIVLCVKVHALSISFMRVYANCQRLQMLLILLISTVSQFNSWLGFQWTDKIEKPNWTNSVLQKCIGVLLANVLFFHTNGSFLRKSCSKSPDSNFYLFLHILCSATDITADKVLTIAIWQIKMLRPNLFACQTHNVPQGLHVVSVVSSVHFVWCVWVQSFVSSSDLSRTSQSLMAKMAVVQTAGTWRT